MKKLGLFFLSMVLLLSLIGCGVNNSPMELTISAAASLQNSLTEIQKAYAQKNPDVKLTFNFGASGTLQEQIEQGAPVDLFISAGKSQMDTLAKKNLLVKDTRVDLLGNDLVLIVAKNDSSITSVQDITKSGVGKISIGTPESVPAGKYAQEALTNLKLWDKVQPNLVLAKDVTQVLSYVETDNVDAGFVYRSDAQGSTKAKIVTALPETSHQPIVYPAAVINASKNKPQAGDFLKYLQSSEAQQIFLKYGFKTMSK